MLGILCRTFCLSGTMSNAWLQICIMHGAQNTANTEAVITGVRTRHKHAVIQGKPGQTCGATRIVRKYSG